MELAVEDSSDTAFKTVETKEKGKRPSFPFSPKCRLSYWSGATGHHFGRYILTPVYERLVFPSGQLGTQRRIGRKIPGLESNSRSPRSSRRTSAPAWLAP